MEQANQQVHPVFQGILNGMCAAPACGLDAYRAALRTFDWQYKFSDDNYVYKKGEKALEALRQQQADLDPSGTIWREYMPKDGFAPTPVVAGARCYAITCYASGVAQFVHKGVYASSSDALMDGLEKFGHDAKIIVREIQ